MLIEGRKGPRCLVHVVLCQKPIFEFKTLMHLLEEGLRVCAIAVKML